MLTRRLLLTAGLLAPAVTWTTSSAAAAPSRTTAGAATFAPAAPGAAVRSRITPTVQLRFPRPTGPFPVGTTELHLVDAEPDDPYVPGRPRELMISVWYPADPRGPSQRRTSRRCTAQRVRRGRRDRATAAGRHGRLDRRPHPRRTSAPVRPGRRPVVVFSPGFGVPRGLASIMVAELASRGYVVVTVDHTYEAAGRGVPRRATRSTDVAAGVVRPAGPRDAGGRRTVRAGPADHDSPAAHNPDAERRHLPQGLGEILDLTPHRRIRSLGRRHHLGRRDGRRPPGEAPASTSTAPSPTATPTRPTARRSRTAPTARSCCFGAGGTGPNGGPQTHRTEPSWGLFWDNSTGWKRDLNVPHGQHYSVHRPPGADPVVPALLHRPAGADREHHRYRRSGRGSYGTAHLHPGVLRPAPAARPQSASGAAPPRDHLRRVIAR